MTWSTGHRERRTRTHRTVELAWRRLPPQDRQLLESIGASQWEVVDGPLGKAANEFLHSAGIARWSQAVRDATDEAFGMWIRELRIVLIRNDHPKLDGLDAATREEFIVWVAWHEWGHALSMERCTSDDVQRGTRLLELAPAGIRERIRMAGYRERDYTHEVIAETYALLMLRRLKGGSGQPPWLNTEIYSLMKTVTEWNE